MAEKLIIREQTINQGDPGYCWLNIELGGIRVGKAGVERTHSRVIIKSINIFPEFERHGFARQTVMLFTQTGKEIIADRVRNTARGFWEHMGFSDTGDGNYRWFYKRRRIDL